MSQGNGVQVVRIGRKGMRAFQFADDPPFQVDVIQVYNEWLAVQEQFLDEHRKIKDGKAYSDALTQFVTAINSHNGGGPVSYAEAAEWLKELTIAQAELADFFDLRRDARWSSLVSSASRPGTSTPGNSTSSGPASPEPAPGSLQTVYETEPAN